MDVERLGVQTGSPGQQSFIVSDRDMSGAEVSARGNGVIAGSAGTWQSCWSVLSAGGVTRGKNHIQTIGDGCDGGAGQTAEEYVLCDAARSDGYLIAGVAIQGVRAYDRGGLE